MDEMATLLSDDARSYIKRLTWGWRAARNQFGFLCWRREGEWIGMTEGEGLIWHAINDEQYGSTTEGANDG